jgi:glutamine amidotransferase-like uncharacterized protein
VYVAGWEGSYYSWNEITIYMIVDEELITRQLSFFPETENVVGFKSFLDYKKNDDVEIQSLKIIDFNTSPAPIELRRMVHANQGGEFNIPSFTPAWEVVLAKC